MKNTFEFDFAEYHGKIHMEEFLISMGNKDQAKIVAYINKLIELLDQNSYPHSKISKYLREGIFELRVNLKNRTTRNLYFFEKNKMIIFTHGFIKKSNKTPKKEIEKAITIKKYWKQENE